MEYNLIKNHYTPRTFVVWDMSCTESIELDSSKYA